MKRLVILILAAAVFVPAFAQTEHRDSVNILLETLDIGALEREVREYGAKYDVERILYLNTMLLFFSGNNSVEAAAEVKKIKKELEKLKK